jgi:hypothetical protein
MQLGSRHLPVTAILPFVSSSPYRRTGKRIHLWKTKSKDGSVFLECSILLGMMFDCWKVVFAVCGSDRMCSAKPVQPAQARTLPPLGVRYYYKSTSAKGSERKWGKNGKGVFGAISPNAGLCSFRTLINIDLVVVTAPGFAAHTQPRRSFPLLFVFPTAHRSLFSKTVLASLCSIRVRVNRHQHETRHALCSVTQRG